MLWISPRSLRSFHGEAPFQASPPSAVTPVLSPRSEASLRSLPADISLAPARLELRSAGACGALELPPGLSLAPASCRGLRSLPGGALHLRLRLREAPGGVGKAAGGDGLGDSYRGLGGLEGSSHSELGSGRSGVLLSFGLWGDKALAGV